MDTNPTAEAAVLETPVPLIDPVPVEEHHPRGSAGSVIAILLIVLLLVVGAFYVWGQRLAEQRAQQTVPAVAD